jgi:PKD repeat protein
VNNPPPPPPPPPAQLTAAVGASPLSGPASLNVGFNGTGSTQGSYPIASYTWNFGDGSTGSGSTTGHVYTTPGTYTATLTVRDTQNNTDTADVTVHVYSGQTNPPPQGGNAHPVKGCFKLVWMMLGRDSFTATLQSPLVATYNPLQNNGASTWIDGTVEIGGQQFPFSFDALKLKAYGYGGLKMSYNRKTGSITVTVKNVRRTRTWRASRWKCR